MSERERLGGTMLLADDGVEMGSAEKRLTADTCKDHCLSCGVSVDRSCGRDCC